jgi:hypothetical protein
LLPIAGKAHCIATQRKRLSNRYRFLACALDVKRGFALPLRAIHTFIKRARHHHCAQTRHHHGRRHIRDPWPDRLIVVVQYANETERNIVHGICACIDAGPTQGTRSSQLQLREISGFAGPRRGFWNSELERTGACITSRSDACIVIATGDMRRIQHGSSPVDICDLSRGAVYPAPGGLSFPIPASDRAFVHDRSKHAAIHRSIVLPVLRRQ